jgi:hypothetical protein
MTPFFSDGTRYAATLVLILSVILVVAGVAFGQMLCLFAGVPLGLYAGALLWLARG